MPRRKQPLIELGPVSAPVARTVGQGGLAWIVMEMIEAYSIYEFSERQWAITLLAGTGAVSWAHNQIEKWRGRRLVGAA